MTTPDTITQIDTALHAIRARLRDLESRPGGTGGSSSTMRLSDNTPLKHSGAGSAGDENAAARGNHVHPAVHWADILDIPVESASADKTYRHVQTIATEVWIVGHNLGKYPTVAVVDSSGAQVIGDLFYISLNQIRLTFSAAISGEAYCN